MCEHGHAGGDPPPPQATPTPNPQNPAHAAAIAQTTTNQRSLADLQNLMHQMLAFQNNSLHNPPTPIVQDRSTTKPERPVLKQNSTDGDWQLLLDSWKRYKEMCKLRDPAEIWNRRSRHLGYLHRTRFTGSHEGSRCPGDPQRSTTSKIPGASTGRRRKGNVVFSQA